MEKKWDKSILINAPIETVWSYLDGSLENMQKIMPNVVDNQPVTVTDNVIGSVYRQSYREGKRVMEYDVHTLDYNNHEDYKKLKIGFNLASMFQIEGCYELTKKSETSTNLRYTGVNKPLKWYIKPFVLLSGDKVVNDFMERVKRVSEGQE
ncbi:SRPBCC family protein [Pseudalkalibacillus hwajinpoensis]|uniref:SRPBCC family protein n=1 Tax=Guptibacillus hwajinpoensis TaxID=208199 RepID=A0A4U1MJ00_9BACL|nr:SRPBCC family protein [Pseudalkalibacillus hwajinpoensis]TKD71359.1 SRPBCC family protein [Pseudalkalibacillus hwajinpoensis]